MPVMLISKGKTLITRVYVVEFVTLVTLVANWTVSNYRYYVLMLTHIPCLLFGYLGPWI